MKNKETRKISELRGWDKNPRSIKEKDFKRLKKQIQKLGQYKPLLITPDGEVIGGNMRLKAYMELDIEDVWVSIVEPKDEAEKLEYALSDNDRAGFYDDDLISNLMPDYPNFNWGDYAVDLKEPQTLDDLIQSLQPIEEDEAPEVSDEPAISQKGEVYQLGRHRLMCGDSTKIEDVEKLMNGQKADMVFTDPPYGMDLDVENSNNLGGKDGWKNKAKHYSKVIGDDKDYNPTHLFEMFSDVKEMFLWGFDYYAEFIPNRKEGSVIVWDKRAGVEDMKLTFSEFELCWSKVKHLREITRITWSGLLGTEQEFDHKRFHPTQKPIKLSAWFLNKYSKEGWNIIDLFGGSGSTLIACEQTNRTCYMMEIDPKYCDVIRRRYAKLIGKEAEWQNL